MPNATVAHGWLDELGLAGPAGTYYAPGSVLTLTPEALRSLSSSGYVVITGPLPSGPPQPGSGPVVQADGSVAWVDVAEQSEIQAAPADAGKVLTVQGDGRWAPQTPTDVSTAAASAVASAVAAGGLLSAATAPALATQRIPDPQLKTGRGTPSPAAFTVSQITTGLPAGLAYGAQSVRAGALSVVISQIFAGATGTADPLRIPVTAGETVTGAMQLWTDQAAAKARVDLVWYNAAGAAISTSAGVYVNIAQNTWEQRVTTAVAPAGAAYCLVQSSIATQSGNTVLGAIGKATAALLYSGTVAAPVYADGTSTGWAWTGTPHASPSKKVLLALGEFETPAGAQAKVDTHGADPNAHPDKLVTAAVPALAQNDAVDPQLKTGGTSSSPGNYPLTRITANLPAGFAYGVETNRTGALTGVIAQVFHGSTAAGAQAWPCAAGEVLSLATYLWTDRPAARARVDVAFYDAGGTLISQVTGTYVNIAQNTWEQRVASGLTAPAGSARVVLTGTVSEQSGVTTIAGAKVRMTGGILQRGIVPAPVYGDGAQPGWVWTGVAHLSASRKLFLSPTERAAAAGAFTLTRLGATVQIARAFAGLKQLVQSVSLTGSANGGFNLLSTTLDGATVHVTSDDICPIRTQMGTVGANHGYANVATFTNPDGKTAADLGSLWQDTAGRHYVLLGFTTDAIPKLVMGGDYVTDGAGIVTSADVAPVTDLTHVSGATHTGAVDHTTAVLVSLLPSIGRVTTTLWADGKPVTADGTQTCHEVVVRESYAILDYGAIYDTARAHVGTSYTAYLATISAAVRVSNTYRWTASGCRVSTSLTELKPTTLAQNGGVQSAIMDLPGATITRYLPGIGVASGFDWTAGVAMAGYATSVAIASGDVGSSGRAPSVSLDVMDSGGVLIGYTMGYLPYGVRGDELSTSGNRLAHAPTKLWDMRDTKKNYPTFTTAEAAGWRHVQAEAFRAYIDPTQVGAVLASKGDAASAWEALAATADLRA